MVKLRRVDKIHIQNFETIEDAWLQFDQRGVIVLKGYNDSGKSAIILALRVLLYDYRRREHTAFVRDDTEYARIVWYDTDGTIVLRDIHSNGQTYYNVYKDSFDNCIFSTVDNGMIVPFDGVPEFVQNIFGVGSYDKLYLNAGDDRDPILLAETSGGDNYKFLSTQLHSDELALASSLLNSDKNAKQTRLSELSAELRVVQKEYNTLGGVTESLVNKVSEMDSQLDKEVDKLEKLEEISNKNSTLSTLAKIPTLEKIDTKRLQVIYDINSKSNILSKEELCILPIIEQKQLSLLKDIIESCTVVNSDIPPIMKTIDDGRLRILHTVLDNINKISTDTLSTELKELEEARLIHMNGIVHNLKTLSNLDSELDNTQDELQKLKTTLGVLEEEVSKYKVQTVKCNNCGSVITIVD